MAVLQNKINRVWWMPVFLLRALSFVGAADPHEAYASFVHLVVDFVARHTSS
ncbi:hypothetical protein T484DRAFT_1891490 [Baffinella frigidus]|nr:hypothetical protein T484DRAFT_1891490 [Cryptophyta sp. CCMP2293]